MINRRICIIHWRAERKVWRNGQANSIARLQAKFSNFIDIITKDRDNHLPYFLPILSSPPNFSSPSIRSFSIGNERLVEKIFDDSEKKKKKRLRLLELLPANDRLVRLERDEGDHDFMNRGDKFIIYREWIIGKIFI